ncbi:hypothetical protein JVT61DRAFT_1345 [Boletus reticuloceps]|uniref:Uncharacterized protein n=1 Tax=Boletus reticuloceps TaxID=495285 RepID=A0A8I3A2A8_9AGAM|nr:hypothetical protein JVT61DRAFT_1345 [Boletus reticuloceps]
MNTAGRVARRIRRLPTSGPRRALQPPPPQDHFNAPLYTFKAFAIATTIIMSTATASVAGVMAYLDVHNTTEFAARMRTWVSQSMPLLTAKIYRYPTSLDTVLQAASTTQSESCTPTTFDHDAAITRLADAFDKGGFDVWAEAAARELEAEMEVERARKRTMN